MTRAHPGIERLLGACGAGDLLAGLLWRAPAQGRSGARALREAQALTSDATHYALAQAGDQVRHGMYQARVSEESVPLPRGALSAAACFARLVGRDAPNAALVLAIPAGGPRQEDRFYVVCLEDGVPVVDVLCHEVEARNALGADERPIWSDNPHAYPGCRPASLAWLGEGADKAARLQRIPANPWPAVVAGLVAVVVVAVWVGVGRWRVAEARRAAAAAAAAADPAPRYRAALAAQRARMAADRGALLSAVQSLFATPVRVPGWRLAAAACDVRSQACNRDWVRAGGTWDDLARARPGERLAPVPRPGTGLPDLDRARTVRPWRLPRGPLPAAALPLRATAPALAQAAPLLQRWRDAGLVLELARPRPWPPVPGLPAGFREPDAVLAGQARLRDVPGPFIVEALRGAPAFVSWEAVSVDVGRSPSPTLLRFTATGTYYVASP